MGPIIVPYLEAFFKKIKKLILDSDFEVSTLILKAFVSLKNTSLQEDTYLLLKELLDI